MARSAVSVLWAMLTAFCMSQREAGQSCTKKYDFLELKNAQTYILKPVKLGDSAHMSAQFPAHAKEDL